MEIFLQDWKLTDNDTFVNLLKNSNMKYMRSYNANTTTSEAFRIIKNMQANKQNGLYKAVVADGKICGHIEIKKADFCKEQTSTISYFLLREYENRGIITKAIKIATELAFNTLGTTSIKAYVASENIASIKALEANGFNLISSFCDKSSSVDLSSIVNIYQLNK